MSFHRRPSSFAIGQNGPLGLPLKVSLWLALALLVSMAGAQALDLSSFTSTLAGSLSGAGGASTNAASNYMNSLRAPEAGSSSSATSMALGMLMRYFEPAFNRDSTGSGASGSAKMLANWQPDDENRKQQVLRELVSKASDLIQNYQSNGLQNVPALPINIPGVGPLMRAPDKVFRAELSMLQDLIRMAQKMTQSPLPAMIDLPKDFAVLMSRMTDQIEQ